jgi:hypothetical protein
MGTFLKSSGITDIATVSTLWSAAGHLPRGAVEMENSAVSSCAAPKASSWCLRTWHQTPGT